MNIQPQQKLYNLTIHKQLNTVFVKYLLKLYQLYKERLNNGFLSPSVSKSHLSTVVGQPVEMQVQYIEIRADSQLSFYILLERVVYVRAPFSRGMRELGTEAKSATVLFRRREQKSGRASPHELHVNYTTPLCMHWRCNCQLLISLMIFKRPPSLLITCLEMSTARKRSSLKLQRRLMLPRCTCTLFTSPSPTITHTLRFDFPDRREIKLFSLEARSRVTRKDEDFITKALQLRICYKKTIKRICHLANFLLNIFVET